MFHFQTEKFSNSNQEICGLCRLFHSYCARALKVLIYSSGISILFHATSRCWTPPLKEKQFEVKLNIIYFGLERYLCKRRARRIPRTNIRWRTQECSQTRMFNISSSWRLQYLSEDDKLYLVVKVSVYLHSSQDIYGPLSQMSHFCQAVGTKHCPYTLYKQQRTYRRRNWHSRAYLIFVTNPTNIFV